MMYMKGLNVNSLVSFYPLSLDDGGPFLLVHVWACYGYVCVYMS